MKHRDLYTNKEEHIENLIESGDSKDICSDCAIDGHYRTCGICGDSICGDCLHEIQFPSKNGIWCCHDCFNEFENLVLKTGEHKLAHIIREK